MKLITIRRDVMSGQCKGSILRMQVRHTAILFLPGIIGTWCGSKIGIFTPRKTKRGYSCSGFYFKPWLAPDIPVCKLPKWYRVIMMSIRFGFE